MKNAFAEFDPISRFIWEQKYQLKDTDGLAVEAVIEDSWRRVAAAAAKAERKGDRKSWEEKFYSTLSDFHFLPAGRILAGAGTTAVCDFI